MRLYYTDLNLKLQRQAREFYGLDLTREPDKVKKLFSNLSPATRYVFTDGIGIWTTDLKPPEFEDYQPLVGEKREIVAYHLNRANLKTLNTDIAGVKHPEQETWSRFWIGSTIHGEERIRILGSPRWPGEILVQDSYFQLFEIHLAGLRPGIGRIEKEETPMLYKLALVAYEKPKSDQALVLIHLSGPPLYDGTLPEYFIEGYISLICPVKGKS